MPPPIGELWTEQGRPIKSIFTDLESVINWAQIDCSMIEENEIKINKESIYDRARAVELTETHTEETKSNWLARQFIQC